MKYIKKRKHRSELSVTEIEALLEAVRNPSGVIVDDLIQGHNSLDYEIDRLKGLPASAELDKKRLLPCMKSCRLAVKVELNIRREHGDVDATAYLAERDRSKASQVIRLAA